jgi:hypothetical protein
MGIDGLASTSKIKPPLMKKYLRKFTLTATGMVINENAALYDG